MRKVNCAVFVLLVERRGMTSDPLDAIQELAKFWDYHDLADFEDQPEEVQYSIFEHKPMIMVQQIHQENTLGLGVLAAFYHTQFKCHRARQTLAPAP